MALVFSSSRRPSAVQFLETAIKDFESKLTPDDKASLQKTQSVPEVDAVMVFTAELDAVNRSRKGRSVASKLHGVLQSVRDFTSVVDTFVPSNPEIASRVWGSIKLSMMVSSRYNMMLEHSSQNG